ncbi:quinone oxidoreductase family protein [Rhodobacter lacus]|uniref:Zinc-binding alcohol dehydrogenase family protein n=1 Tax=Rhodobacter lacus TaxID=1641972 RepID=A0ABW5A9H7_9RHOB
MKALRFTKYGQPDVLHVDTLDIPVPAPGEVLVKIAAAAINPSDVKNVAGLFKARLPRVPGRDFAGTVVSDGPDKGREVWGSGAGFGVIRDGAQAEYICLPADWLSDKPAHLSMAEAASVGVPFVTAWGALVRAGQIQRGETVLITGSTGAVGRAAIQIARWQGARVIGLGRRDRLSEADLYINTETTELQPAVLEATDGKGVDMVLDIVGGPMFEPALATLRQGGRQIAITSTGGPRVSFDLVDFYHRQLELRGVDTMKLSGPEIAQILDTLRAGFVTGALTAPQLDLSAITAGPEVYEALRAGRATRKQVISFG